MTLRRDQTIAFQMRALFRSGGKLPERVEPKFVAPLGLPTSQAVANFQPACGLGRYALPEPFADMEGLPLDFIKSLLDQGKITHMVLPNGEIRIKVAKAKEEIDALTVKRTPTRLNFDSAA